MTQDELINNAGVAIKNDTDLQHFAQNGKVHENGEMLPPEDNYEKPSKEKLKIINKARSIIRGERTLDGKGLKKLINDLVKLEQFAYATEVLLIKMRSDKSIGITLKSKDYETLAKFIYKDHSLPSSLKFKTALQELSSREDLSNTERCETLGMAGAIYKRKWQFDHQFRNLILSRYYYKRGYERWKESIQELNNPLKNKNKDDNGYNAINYAYINELMAIDKLEEHGSTTGFTESIKERFAEAQDTRIFILDQFIKKQEKGELELLELKEQHYEPWVYATIAEAFFGLCNYKQAFGFIKYYISLKTVDAWEVRSFGQQMFSLAYLQNYCKNFESKYRKMNLPFKEKLAEIASKIDSKEIDLCLQIFKDPNNVNALDISNKATRHTNTDEIKEEGKLGLALSGGGFRSAFFHIGVLAAMAEKDELKNVEIISCVSGGSIIGAFYYLKLKKLFEEKSDEKNAANDTDYITKQDYINIVKEIEVEFLKGVQKNLRVRIFSDITCNFKMFNKHYSRSHRLGELYEEFLFKDLIKVARTEEDIKNGKKKDEIYMSDLFIRPKDAPEDFSIATDNWKRKNKVPQLVLNATSVNTGHNWQFTASWMGEPPGNIQTDIDVKPRLRRMYYEEAPKRYRNFRLGYAVAASSCVPVMFHPMPLPDLYPNIDLQLIDGGVHDNQGIGALIEQECKNMIISDGSGQMPTDKVSSKNAASLFYRSDTILQERLRELQFLDIKQRNSTTQINSLLTAHLKSDLENRPISWKFCTDPPRTIMYSNIANSDNDLTKYGILRNVQLHLSQIRTDLDSFNDVEAFALMYSGYAQLKYEYKREREEINSEEDTSTDDQQQWQFLKIRNYVTLPDKAVEKEKLLKEASRVPFKMFYLSTSVKYITLVCAILALLLLIFMAFFDKQGTYVIIDITLKVVIIMLMVGFILKVLAEILHIRTTLRKNVAFAAILIPAYAFSKLYLWLLNDRYNQYGNLENDTASQTP